MKIEITTEELDSALEEARLEHGPKDSVEGTAFLDAAFKSESFKVIVQTFAEMRGNQNGNKPVVRIGITSEVFPSARQAAKATGIDATTITSCLKGRQKTAGGFRWAYAEKESL